MDPYVGEIKLFAGNYAPIGWALCNGQIMHIQQNPMLYSVIGNIYGGDGKTTFALPNMQGMAPMGQGAGPGLTPRNIGDEVGGTTQTLTIQQLPSHTHVPNGTSVSSTTTAKADPTNNTWGSEGANAQFKPYASSVNAAMNPLALNTTGGSSAHNNMQPFLTLSFIIALEGVFPPKQ